MFQNSCLVSLINRIHSIKRGIVINTTISRVQRIVLNVTRGRELAWTNQTSNEVWTNQNPESGFRLVRISRAWTNVLIDGIALWRSTEEHV